jgi:hypothetical protein
MIPLETRPPVNRPRELSEWTTQELTLRLIATGVELVLAERRGVGRHQLREVLRLLQQRSSPVSLAGLPAATPPPLSGCDAASSSDHLPI